MSKSKVPMTRLMPNGEELVLTEWVKMLVPNKGDKGYEKFYSHQNGTYKKLNSDGSFTLIAFQRPRYNEPLPQHLEPCSQQEIDYLEKSH